MANIILHQFESKEIRSAEVGGEQWFVLADVLSGMDSSTTVTAAKTNVEEVLGEGYVIDQPLQTPGGWQVLALTSPDAVTFLVSRSRTEAGRRLCRWIFTEVLPSIRKTGKYALSEQPALPPHKLAVEIAHGIREITDTLDDNPRLAQALIDLAMNQVIEKSLPSASDPQLPGVVEIAHEMGYKLDDSSRVKLGKFVKAQGFAPQKEKRICNGVLTPINCYADTPELREAISAYFD